MPESRYLSAIAAVVAAFLPSLDTAITPIALPHMQGDLAATPNEISWTVTSYVVARMIMTLPASFLANRFGRKIMMAAMVAGFTISSALCGLATSVDDMVLYRILQGATGAGLIPLALTVLLDAFGPADRGKAVAVWSVTTMIGPTVGPVLGGFISEYYGWRWIFLGNVPIGVLALLVVAAGMRESRQRSSDRLDVTGFLWLSLALALAQVVLDQGELLGWFSSTQIVLLSCVAALSLYLFIVHMFTADSPFISRALLRNVGVCAGLLVNFILGVLIMCVMTLLPMFLQTVQRIPVLTSSYILTPHVVTATVVIVLVGRFRRLTNSSWTVAAGFSVAAVASYWFSKLTVETASSELVSGGIIMGLGLGLVFVPVNVLTLRGVPEVLRSEAAALVTLARGVGSSFGISIAVTLLARSAEKSFAVLAENVTHANVEAARWLAMDATGYLGLRRMVENQSTAIAYADDFRMLMWCSLVAVALTPLLTPRNGSSRGERDSRSASVKVASTE